MKTVIYARKSRGTEEELNSQIYISARIIATRITMKYQRYSQR